MPYPELKGLLTDIGTEELGHLEMVATIVHQLTRNLTDEEVRSDPSFASYFVDRTTGVYPTAASGFPWSAASMAVKGDLIADLTEDLAAEGARRKTRRRERDQTDWPFLDFTAILTYTLDKKTRNPLVSQKQFGGFIDAVFRISPLFNL